MWLHRREARIISTSASHVNLATLAKIRVNASYRLS